MFKRFKQFFLICGAILSFYAIERFCHRETDGFALVNIYSPEKALKHRTKPHSNEIIPLLNQKFHYLTCGSQSYVFISEDQEYVLKFFKFQHMRIPPFLEFIPLPTRFDQIREKKKEKKRLVREKTLESYYLAFSHFQNESGLLYVHLDSTDFLNLKVPIYDKIGIRHEIELDKVEFVLQKRANLVHDTLKNWVAKGDLPRAEKALNHLLKLAAKRCKRGLGDIDPDFSTNFGFTGDQPIQIDPGRLFRDMTCSDPKNYTLEMIRITRDFRQWILENCPELLPSFDETMQEPF